MFCGLSILFISLGKYKKSDGFRFMVFKDTFNNISVISWQYTLILVTPTNKDLIFYASNKKI